MEQYVILFHAPFQAENSHFSDLEVKKKKKTTFQKTVFTCHDCPEEPFFDSKFRYLDYSHEIDPTTS